MYIIKESNKLAYTKSVLLTFFENFMFLLVARGVGFNGSFSSVPSEEFCAACSALQAVHVTR
jgi:hypothetical protein